MTLVPSFLVLSQTLAAGMTAPSFANFLTLLAGWVFTSRRTVTSMIVVAGVARGVHHSIVYRFFACARWVAR